MWRLAFVLILLQAGNSAPGSRFCNFHKSSPSPSKSPTLSTSVEKEATIIVKYTSRYRAALFQDVVKSGLRGDIQSLIHRLLAHSQLLCVHVICACLVAIVYYWQLWNLPHIFFATSQILS